MLSDSRRVGACASSSGSSSPRPLNPSPRRCTRVARPTRRRHAVPLDRVDRRRRRARRHRTPRLGSGRLGRFAIASLGSTVCEPVSVIYNLASWYVHVSPFPRARPRTAARLALARSRRLGCCCCCFSCRPGQTLTALWTPCVQRLRQRRVLLATRSSRRASRRSARPS